MLSERDMQELSNLSSKLAVEGYDVETIKTILASERAKINAAEVVKLLDYFDINSNVGIRLAKINYGFNKMTLNITATLERKEGVFSEEDKPTMFEGVLKNAIFNCLRQVKTEYDKEAEELSPTPSQNTTRAATEKNPLVFTIASNVLYAIDGIIDTAFAWNVVDIKDVTGNSINNNDIETTATSENLLTLEITNGIDNLIFTIISGTFDGSDIIDNNVAVSGGI